MGHANPEWKKEGQLIRYMIEQAYMAYLGDINEAYFLRQLKQGVKEIYGEPLQEESPHFIRRIEDLLLDYPTFSFREARVFLLAEFYPGKEGFYAVKEYWRSKRRDANDTH